MAQEQSEFGKGLVVCLVKFSQHALELQDLPVDNQPHYRYGMILNGASDHLYEIEVPQGEEWSKVRKDIKALRNKALHLGHTKIEATRKQVIELFDKAIDIALEIDKLLGLKPDRGEW